MFVQINKVNKDKIMKLMIGLFFYFLTFIIKCMEM